MAREQLIDRMMNTAQELVETRQRIFHYESEQWEDTEDGSGDQLQAAAVADQEAEERLLEMTLANMAIQLLTTP